MSHAILVGLLVGTPIQEPLVFDYSAILAIQDLNGDMVTDIDCGAPRLEIVSAFCGVRASELWTCRAPNQSRDFGAELYLWTDLDQDRCPDLACGGSQEAIWILSGKNGQVLAEYGAKKGSARLLATGERSGQWYAVQSVKEEGGVFVRVLSLAQGEILRVPSGYTRASSVQATLARANTRLKLVYTHRSEGVVIVDLDSSERCVISDTVHASSVENVGDIDSDGSDEVLLGLYLEGRRDEVGLLSIGAAALRWRVAGPPRSGEGYSGGNLSDINGDGVRDVFSSRHDAHLLVGEIALRCGASGELIKAIAGDSVRHRHFGFVAQWLGSQSESELPRLAALAETWDYRTVLILVDVAGGKAILQVPTDTGDKEGR